MRTPAQTATGSGARHSLVRRGGIDATGADEAFEVGGVGVEGAELGDRSTGRRHHRAVAGTRPVGRPRRARRGVPGFP